MGDDAVRGLSTGELVRRLIDNLSGMVDREVDLAKEEARSDATHVGKGVAILVFGLLLLYSFAASLIVAAVFAIAGAMDAAMAPVTASLVVAGVFLVLGMLLALVGWRMAKIQPLQRTRESLKDDVAWARRQVR